MLNASVMVRLTDRNTIHSEGGVIHDAGNVVGQHAELCEGYGPNGGDVYLVTTGYEDYGSAASYEIPADDVVELIELDS